MSDIVTGLQFYSIGVVAESKTPGNDVIKVWPAETFPMESGKLGKSSREFKSELPDITGVKKKAKISGGAFLNATWLSDGGSNRDTSPDVCAGETVKIWRYADTEKYYWSTLMREPELRRQEHVRYTYSNQPSGTTPADTDSSYFIEVSTLEKHIRIRTASNDGEPCRYDIKISTAKGSIEISDDLDNKVFLDSVAGVLAGQIREKIGLKSKLIHLEADELKIKAPTTIHQLALVEGLVTPGVAPGSGLIEEFDWP